MELDSLIRHFFGCDDPGALSAAEFARGVEALRIGFAVERESGRRFALWVLLAGLDSAPPPADAFAKEPSLRAAAEDYLRAQFRLERWGEAATESGG